MPDREGAAEESGADRAGGRREPDEFGRSGAPILLRGAGNSGFAAGERKVAD
ncbi:hypothetical protein [Pilosibacter fragilis]|uniref:hypothetical protein n=1 Tax=Pilosibacter fragilis TaxID=3078042 RepID=UPI0031BBC0AA